MKLVKINKNADINHIPCRNSKFENSLNYENNKPEWHMGMNKRNI